VIECLLSGIFATHLWTYGNQLTRVCEYRCPREKSLHYYHNPVKKYILWDYSCPRSVKVNPNGKIQRKNSYFEQTPQNRERGAELWEKEVGGLCEGWRQGQACDIRRPEYEDQKESARTQEQLPLSSQLRQSWPKDQSTLLVMQGVVR
jgi:hypothetical protein